MPLYEYQCRPCGRTFEALVQNGAAPVCPVCQSQDLERLLSVFAVGARDRGGFDATPRPCGSCGDPRGAGACAIK